VVFFVLAVPINAYQYESRAINTNETQRSKNATKYDISLDLSLAKNGVPKFSHKISCGSGGFSTSNLLPFKK